MLIDDFAPTKTGQLVPIQGAPDANHAFLPNPLPPADWRVPETLYPLLIEARVCLARLDGIGRHLPNSDILLRPIQRREAQLSSKLEGTITDAKQQALFEADPRYPTSASDPVNAYREVFNYSRALRLKDDGLPLSKRLIRQLHTVLMDGVRGYQGRAGEFRTIQNQINIPARYVPPPPEFVEKWMDDFEEYLNAPNESDQLVRAFIAHYQFEAIHPFTDGNGRVGRLLLALTIAEWCGLKRQWLYMSPYFERYKEEYMNLLLGVSTHGNWDEWIEYCLNGVIVQAKDTESRCEDLLKLHEEFVRNLKGGSVRLFTIVGQLFDHPVVTVLAVKELLGVTYPTARADLRRLEELGILRPLEGLPTITYYCEQVFAITNKDMEET